MNPILAAEMYGWWCYLCETAIDKEPVWPDPKSASADHVIPLGKGGGGLSDDNIRPTHLGCNLTKGVRDVDSAKDRISQKNPPKSASMVC